MEDKIEINEYVRTPLGIAKYLGECDDMQNFYEFDKLDEELWFGDIANVIYQNELDKVILKHSPNIIDLIEDKDIVILEYYVSKYRKRIQRIFEIEILGNDICFLNHRCSFLYNKEKQKFIDGKGFNPKIKAIATKEQFESIEYKL